MRSLGAATLLLLALSGCSLFQAHLASSRPPNYIVFFHYDNADLTAEARKIVDKAAADAKSLPAIKIEVAGYLDSATAPPGSQHFSEPRFKAVEQALIADGIDPRLLVRVQLADSEAALPPNGDRRIEIWLIGKGGEGPPYHPL